MVRNEDAVSPVIGVMLMLVVTIIIAASVTLFSTGFIGDLSNSIDSSTNTKIRFVGVDDAGAMEFNDAYVAEYGQNANFKTLDITGDIGLVFEVVSGDPLDLTTLEILVSGPAGGNAYVSYNDLPSIRWTTANETRINAITLSNKFFGKNAARIVPYPVPDENEMLKKTTINPGEKFIVVTEYICAYDTNSMTHDKGLVGIAADRLHETHSSTAELMDSRTVIKLFNKESGQILLSCLGSDGVYL